MCEKMKGHCFTAEQKKELNARGWTQEQIDFAEDSIIEDKIKESLSE